MFLKILSVAGALLFLGGGCVAPCESLAEQICSCRPNSSEENACLQEIKAQTLEPTEAEDQLCTTLLDSCTCDALEQNDLAACGIARQRTP